MIAPGLLDYGHRYLSFYNPFYEAFLRKKVWVLEVKDSAIVVSMRLLRLLFFSFASLSMRSKSFEEM